MATYIYRCSEGHHFESTVHGKTRCHMGPDDCSGAVARDYRAENAGVAIANLQREREAGGKEGLKRLFLPHNDDFKGPGDPDGTKGMRAWREQNQPKAGNTNPDWPGYVEKKVM